MPLLRQAILLHHKQLLAQQLSIQGYGCKKLRMHRSEVPGFAPRHQMVSGLQVARNGDLVSDNASARLAARFDETLDGQNQETAIQ